MDNIIVTDFKFINENDCQFEYHYKDGDSMDTQVRTFNLLEIHKSKGGDRVLYDEYLAFTEAYNNFIKG